MVWDFWNQELGGQWLLIMIKTLSGFPRKPFMGCSSESNSQPVLWVCNSHKILSSQPQECLYFTAPGEDSCLERTASKSQFSSSLLVQNMEGKNLVFQAEALIAHQWWHAPLYLSYENNFLVCKLSLTCMCFLWKQTLPQLYSVSS